MKCSHRHCSDIRQCLESLPAVHMTQTGDLAHKCLLNSLNYTKKLIQHFFLSPYNPGIGGLGGFTGVPIGTAKKPKVFLFCLREIAQCILMLPLRAWKTRMAS